MAFQIKYGNWICIYGFATLVTVKKQGRIPDKKKHIDVSIKQEFSHIIAQTVAVEKWRVIAWPFGYTQNAHNSQSRKTTFQYLIILFNNEQSNPNYVFDLWWWRHKSQTPVASFFFLLLLFLYKQRPNETKMRKYLNFTRLIIWGDCVWIVWTTIQIRWWRRRRCAS